MGSPPVVLEISSDEEGGLDESDDSPFDWLAEMLSSDKEAEESNDVVVVDEVSCVSTTQKQNCMASGMTKDVSGDDSDDDCLVLDADPDKPVSIEDDRGNGSDDLSIVSEKGQVACRDFPHPRHDCAKFPFDSTPHERHCHLCHCFVCDLLAPCLHWGTGISSTDHCHSTNKEEVWTLQREWVKQGNSPLPIQELLDATLMKKPSPCNSESAPSFSEPLTNLVSQHISVSRLVEPHASSATRFGRLNIMSHSNNALLRPVHGRSGYTHTINGQRGVGAVTLGPQFIDSRRRFKRVGSPGGTLTTANRFSCGLSNVNQDNTIHPRIQSPQFMLGDHTRKRFEVVLGSVELESDTFQDYCYPNGSSSYTDFLRSTISSQPQAYSQFPTPQNANLNMPQFGNPTVNHGNLDPSDNVMCQYPSSADPPLLNTLPSKVPPGMQADRQHLQSYLGSSDFHLDSWMYNMGNQFVENPRDLLLADRDFGLPQPMMSDPAMLPHELGSMWAV
ncbi:uncharacterized protein LOC131240593 [Magnolia sinica]|uniref:uncharacterized protein LOC131240593 n=1 Tax=Magnolia sinica TaxID=86752 RepID=UPI0026582FA9|nr:uncharacterized protein LOC131240593 [Magnolia sinica]